ncbi:hypothetical protein STVIR_4214 [Streptomyces viridochromogenes Tue57]|uniref:Uncharacterized protein n=1 Tax=Streptomyces viridochromogenes Tue57 TaxID=1160705 RepID=L8PHA4_STRVR|nr:hypothetical protein STVIR_4214 [Streptomyces viridochromogenes Tue57]
MHGADPFLLRLGCGNVAGFQSVNGPRGQTPRSGRESAFPGP